MNTLQLHEPPSCIGTRFERTSADIDHAERTSLHDLFRLMGFPVGDEERSPLPLPAVRRIRAGDLLIIEGAAAASIYIARTGTFKMFRTAEDGYEQIFGFARRGDLLGCDALSGDRHRTAAMALSDASALAVASSDFLALMNGHPAFSRGMMRAVGNAMIDLTRLSDMMAPVSAEVRLARFLMHLSHQWASCGQSATSLSLEMSRRDIASYIGVASETISRSFAALADACLVEVAKRKVRIIDLDALQKYAQGTRAPAKSLARAPAAVPRPRLEAVAALAA
jgi:CRP/FNR family transcriptional regulator